MPSPWSTYRVTLAPYRIKVRARSADEAADEAFMQIHERVDRGEIDPPDGLPTIMTVRACVGEGEWLVLTERVMLAVGRARRPGEPDPTPRRSLKAQGLSG